MRIVRRYFLKEFLKTLAVLALGLSVIFSLIDLIDKIDEFMPGKPSAAQLMQYAFLNLPKFLYFLLPMAMLICSLFVFSQASRNKEIVAVKAMGGRLRNLFYPFLVLGLLTSAVGFLIGEVVVPNFSEQSNDLKAKLTKKENRLSFREGTLWMRGTDGSFVRIELYVPGRQMIKGMSVFIKGNNFLKQRIEAEEAYWTGTGGAKGSWKLKDVTIYDFEKSEVAHVAEMDYAYLESPDFLGKGIKKVEEMDIQELYRYTKRLRAAGFRDTKLVVDLNSKVSYPLASFFMLVLGTALAVMGRIGGGIFAAGVGILISFVYWLLYTLVLSMGYTRVIPPYLAAWIAPILFSIVAAYLFRKIPE